MSTKIKGATYVSQSPDERIRGISLLFPVSDRGGFVFLLASVEKMNADAERLFEILGDQTRRLAESFGKEANPQHRFEQFLGALNETLAGHVKEGHWNVPIAHLNALVGIASSNQMYLSGTGDLLALFLHKKPSQRYQLFNLFRSLQTEQSLLTWEKAFAVVLDGDLNPGDVFCVSDQDLQHTIPPDELNHLLSSLPPTGAVDKMRQYFPYKNGILLTVLKVQDDSQHYSVAPQRTAVPQSNLSVAELNATEDETDRLLDDQRPNLMMIAKRIVALLRSKSDQKSRLLSDLQMQDGFQKSIRRVLRVLWKVVLEVSRKLVLVLKRTINTLTNKEQRPSLKQGLQQTQAQAITLLERAQRLPRSTTYLVGAIVLAIIVLTTGISFLSTSQARAEQERAYQTDVAHIEELLEKAGGAIIYKDEDQARTLLMNAQTRIEQLTSTTPEQQETTQRLSRNIQESLNEIRRIVTIPNPPLMADLAVIADGVVGTALTLAQNQVTVSASDGRLYSYNRTEKRFDALTDTQTDPSSFIAISQESNRILTLDQEGEIFHTTTQTPRLVSTQTQDPNWIDVEAYANRVYVLRKPHNETQGQIIRFSQSEAQLSSPSDWITSRTSSLDDVVAFTIDGNIYILKQDGSILRFTSGSETGWETKVVEPRITSATRIWTDTESDYLYVLEPATKRLIVFSKETGAFVTQYRSDAFEGLSDVVVDEAGYTIYLLAGSKLYSIAPSHL